ncbi:Hemicentin-1 [Bulinus truncatus]|nr:Hemicentin-1 [Bulinus truncatus]
MIKQNNILTFNHTKSPSQQVTITASHHHSKSPSNQVTITASYHHSKSPSLQVTITASQHHTKSPTHQVTHTPSHPHTKSPTHQVTHTPNHPHTKSPTHQVTHTPSHPHTKLPSSKSPSQQVTITTSYHHSKSPLQQVTNTASYQHNKLPSQQVTITASYHHSKLPSQPVTIKPSYHYSKLPSQQVTITASQNHTKSPTHQVTHTPSHPHTKSPTHQVTIQQVTITASYHHSKLPSQQVTITASHQHNKLPSQQVTITASYHHSKLPSQQVTNSTSYHHSKLPSQQVTNTTSYHHSKLPSQQVTITASYHHNKLPSQQVTITARHHHTKHPFISTSVVPAWPTTKVNMMFTRLIVTLVIPLSLFLLASSAEGRVVCYRRLKKRNQCGGHLKKENYVTVDACCSGKGEGYANKKVKLGRNRFKCSPCPDGKVKSSPKEEFLDHLNRPTVTSAPTPAATTTLSTTTEFDWPTPPQREDFQVDPNLPPPRDDTGQLIVWEAWSPCSVSCGAGWRSRAKVCDKCDLNDYENIQSQPCMINFYCPVDGNWGPWFPWDSCSSTCNNGVRNRHRKCNYPPPAYGGEPCAGEGHAIQDCNTRPCPVDGGWGEWTNYSDCSSSCGSGTSKRTRQCDSPVSLHGGKDCVGPDINSKKCEIVKCPVDGGWSLWNAWTWCTVTCGRGVRERSRTCESPKPQHGGKDCEGLVVEQDECYGGRPCPVDGGWSEWSAYGYCRAARCSNGHKIRTRQCINPNPAHGGKPCVGQQYERISCFNDQDCPRNGSWCDWSEWNSCSTTCRQNSLQGRHRVCACPSPKNGGLNCQGDSLEVRRCEEFPECSIPEPTTQPENLEETYDEDSEDLLETQEPPRQTEIDSEPTQRNITEG